ncbi:hypothetical protein ACR6C2_18160 [Streptomyces sp. INA 01156]
MKALGKHLHESRGGLEHAERWLLAAAEAGDHEAMYHLSRVYRDLAGKRRRTVMRTRPGRPTGAGVRRRRDGPRRWGS